MIIKKNLIHSGKTYHAITDDTRIIEGLIKNPHYEAENKLQTTLTLENILLVRNKQNQHFVDSLLNNTSQNIHIIQSHALSEVFAYKQDMKIVGITGTNGKTTTAAIMYSLLLDLGYRVGLLGTRGLFINDKQYKPKGLTTPSVLELYENLSLATQHECDYFIMEVSSHAISQERIAGLNFALKILTNITSDHLDYHKSIEEYREVKNSFLNTYGPKLINADEKNALVHDKESYFYGIENRGNLSVEVYALEDGIEAHILWQEKVVGAGQGAKMTQQNCERCAISTYLYGKHNLYNLLAALAAVKILTCKPLAGIAQVLEHFGGVSGRMEVVNQEPLVIVDFAHTHDGMAQIFESFYKRKIVVVFGAGGDRDKSKRPKMGACAQKYAHKIYITSDNPRSENPQVIINDILSGMQQDEHVIIEPDRRRAIHLALSSLDKDEVLLILGKGDETYQIVGNQKLHFDDREVVKEYFLSHPL